MANDPRIEVTPEMEALEVIAEACRQFLTAHRKREPSHQWSTLNEETATWQLRESLRLLDVRRATRAQERQTA